VGVKFLF